MLLLWLSVPIHRRSLSTRFKFLLLWDWLAGTLLATLIGLFIGAPTLRIKGDYFIIATMGIGEAAYLLAQYLIPITGGPYGYLDFRSFRGLESVYYVIPCTVFTIVITAFLIKSKAGRNFVAIREDEMAAVTVGIDVFKYKMAAMGYSSALCGLAGGLLAHYMTNVNPAMFTSAKSNELLIAVVLGGRGSLTGVILAAAIPHSPAGTAPLWFRTGVASNHLRICHCFCYSF